MKQKFLIFLSVALLTGFLFAACKKSDSDSVDNSTTDAQIATQIDDESMISGETDDLTTDANAAMESDASFSGDNAIVTQIICDADVVFNKNSDPMTMTITFNGESCSTKRTRTGVVVVSIPKGTEWKTAGSAVTINYQSVKIIRASDNKTIILNGTQTYTNVSGGSLMQLVSTGPITHTLTSSNMSISFDNETARTWSIAKQRVYSFNGGAVLTVSGTHTEGDLSGIAEWGTNRFGGTFTTAISTPLVYKQECDFRLTSGVATHTTTAFTATATFGLDSTGAVTGCPGTGHYYYNLDWTRKNGNHFSIVLPY